MNRYPILLMVLALSCSSCSTEKKLVIQISKVYGSNRDKVLGGEYVVKNRQYVLDNLPRNFLRGSESLILVEKVRYLREYYDCSIFNDSLRYYYRAKRSGIPKRIDIKEKPLSLPKLAFYIHEKIMSGELDDILKQGEKVHFVHPSSIFVTIVKREGNSFNVSGYDLHEFVPREKRMERDSIKNLIKSRPSN